MSFETISGPGNVPLHEAAHIISPGRGRTADGMGLHVKGYERAAVAASIYHELDGDDTPFDGRLVLSGYKSPADNAGDPVSYFDPYLFSVETYSGKPEAILARDIVLKLGVPKQVVRTEINSIDTVTNFVRSEQLGYFGRNDVRPVAIASQAEHLDRIMNIIAPRTLRRDYIGVIVPESPDNERDRDSVMARIFSRMVLAGIHQNTDDVVRKTDTRAKRLWGMANFLQNVVPKQ